MYNLQTQNLIAIEKRTAEDHLNHQEQLHAADITRVKKELNASFDLLKIDFTAQITALELKCVRSFSEVTSLKLDNTACIEKFKQFEQSETALKSTMTKKIETLTTENFELITKSQKCTKDNINLKEKYKNSLDLIIVKEDDAKYFNTQLDVKNTEIARQSQKHVKLNETKDKLIHDIQTLGTVHSKLKVTYKELLGLYNVNEEKFKISSHN